VLLIAAAIALLWANSPLTHSYHALWQWHLPLSVQVGSFTIIQPQSLHFWVNDALMSVFFLVAGLEIRREFHAGSLSKPRQASLPIIAALGGVIAPALIYIALNHHPARIHGWAGPTATDIAFAVGILALLGRSIPANVRIFLLALAIIDDLIAVLIIALFYSDGLNAYGLLIAALGILAVLGFQRLGIGSAFSYVLPGAVIWIGLLRSGAHPVLAGVILGLLTPVTSRFARQREQLLPVVRVQRALHPWVAYGIMPLFALANAGVSMGSINLSASDTRWVAVGIALALIAGKPLGVIGMSWMMVRLKWCQLSPGVTWGGIGLIGVLAGVGFTLSIFIAMLAFESETLRNAAKLGVMLGSLIAALAGLAWGVVYRRREKLRTA
jgi:NhaA family Na+:H+ antiporter